MANKKVSELAAITSEVVASSDVIPIVDVDTSTTKKITKAELAEAIGISNTPVDLTGLTDGDSLVYESGETRFVPAQTLAVSANGSAAGDVLEYDGDTSRYVASEKSWSWPFECAPGYIPVNSMGSGQIWRCSSSSGITWPNGRLHGMPVAFNRGVPFTFSIYATSGVASSTASIGIYENDESTDMPGTLLFNETISTATNGIKATTGAFTPVAGRKYWIAFLTETALASIASMSAPTGWCGLQAGYAGNFNPASTYYRESVSGGIPSSFGNPLATMLGFPWVALTRTT